MASGGGNERLGPVFDTPPIVVPFGLMALEKFILDQGKREKRERSLGVDLEPSEHDGSEKEEIRLKTILTNPAKSELYGELMESMYPSESAAMFERIAKEEATVDDVYALNRARYEYERRSATAEKIGAGVTADEVQSMSTRSGAFDSFAGLLENDTRAAEIVRDHILRMAMRGDTDGLKNIQDAQERLKKVRESGSCRKADKETRWLKEKYGFSETQWSMLEKSNWEPDERKELREEIHERYGAFKKAVDWATFNSISGHTMRKTMRHEKGEANEMIREHVKEHIGPFWGFLDSVFYFSAKRRLGVRKIKRSVRKIEESNAYNIIRKQHRAIGDILGLSILHDDRLRQMLVKESQGGPKAEAINKAMPVTLADTISARGSLNKASYESDFKKFLLGRRSAGLDTTNMSDHAKQAEIAAFDKQYGKSERVGFFAQILDAMRRLFSTGNKSSLMRPDLWTV